MRKILKKINIFIKDISTYDYDFGIDAEKTLKDEFSLILEEKKKERIYNELKNYIDVNKSDFEEIYEKLKSGFLNIKDIHSFLEEYEKIFKKFPLIRFLSIVLKYDTAKYRTEIKFQINE